MLKVNGVELQISVMRYLPKWMKKCNFLVSRTFYLSNDLMKYSVSKLNLHFKYSKHFLHFEGWAWWNEIAKN